MTDGGLKHARRPGGNLKLLHLWPAQRLKLLDPVRLQSLAADETYEATTLSWMRVYSRVGLSYTRVSLCADSANSCCARARSSVASSVS